MNNVIDNIRQVHGLRYEYVYEEVLNSKQYIKIICEHHGVFSQRLDNHLSGNGCPICSKEQIPGVYSLKLFESKPTLKNTPGIFYVLDVYSYDRNESFIKIGITQQTSPEKIKTSLYKSKYNTRIVGLCEDTLYYVYRLEQTILSLFESYKYTPQSVFKGKTECLDSMCKYDLLTELHTFAKRDGKEFTQIPSIIL